MFIFAIGRSFRRVWFRARVTGGGRLSVGLAKKKSEEAAAARREALLV